MKKIKGPSELNIIKRLLAKQFNKPDAICSAQCFGCSKYCTMFSCELFWEKMLSDLGFFKECLFVGIKNIELIEKYRSGEEGEEK